MKCEELVARSFPPNLNWLDYGQPGFDSHLFATFGPGQWVEYVLQIPEPGTYQITTEGFAGKASGTVQLFVDGNKQGDPQDLFAAARAAQSLNWGNCTFLKAGKAILRFAVTGKNSQSQDFQMEFDSIRLANAKGFNLICPNGASL